MVSFGRLSCAGKEVEIWRAWPESQAPVPPSTPASEAEAWGPRGIWKGGLGGLPGKGLEEVQEERPTHLMSIAAIFLLLPAILFPQYPGRQRQGDGEICPGRH